MTDNPLSGYFTFLVGVTVFYALFSVWMVFHDWAKRTAGEAVEDNLAKERRFQERRQFLRQSAEGVRRIFGGGS